MIIKLPARWGRPAWLLAAIGLTAASAVLAACSPADQQGFLQNISNGIQEGIAPGSVAVLPGGLEHLFASGSFNDSAPLASQYPRVAFTVISSPPNHGAYLLASNMSRASGCWQLSAVIWRSATQSQPVAPFNVCLQDLIRAPAAASAPLVSYMDYSALNGPLRSNNPGETTGTQRTSGPRPPATPFPQGVQYARYFGSITSQVAPSENSAEAWFWAALLYHLDFDPAHDNDRRFWVVTYNNVTP